VLQAISVESEQDRVDCSRSVGEMALISTRGARTSGRYHVVARKKVQMLVGCLLLAIQTRFDVFPVQVVPRKEGE
jgi:hypothetical protein